MAQGDHASTGRLADRVAGDLRARIAAGEYKPGDKLPSQNELAARYQVAKMTAYQAITQLREQGLVYARHGSGVYVAEPPVATSLFTAVSAAVATGQVTIDALAPNARLLAAALRAPLARIVAGLDRPPSGQIRLLATTPDVEDYAYLQLRDDLQAIAALSLERRTVGPSSQFGFVLINEADLFVGLSSEDHASLPPTVVAEQLLHAGTGDTAGTSQISAVRDWFAQVWDDPGAGPSGPR